MMLYEQLAARPEDVRGVGIAITNLQQGEDSAALAPMERYLVEMKQGEPNKSDVYNVPAKMSDEESSTVTRSGIITETRQGGWKGAPNILLQAPERRRKDASVFKDAGYREEQRELRRGGENADLIKASARCLATQGPGSEEADEEILEVMRISETEHARTMALQSVRVHCLLAGD